MIIRDKPVDDEEMDFTTRQNKKTLMHHRLNQMIIIMCFLQMFEEKSYNSERNQKRTILCANYVH